MVKSNFNASSEIKVHIYAEDSAKPFDEITLDETGYYSFDNLREGVYTIRVTVDGEGKYVINFVVDEDIIHNIILVSEGVARLLDDVNNDKKVDKKDFAVLKRYCIGKSTLEGSALLADDANRDNKVDKRDFATLKRHCLSIMLIV